MPNVFVHGHGSLIQRQALTNQRNLEAWFASLCSPFLFFVRTDRAGSASIVTTASSHHEMAQCKSGPAQVLHNAYTQISTRRQVCSVSQSSLKCLKVPNGNIGISIN